MKELAAKDLGLGFQYLRGTRGQARAGARLSAQLGYSQSVNPLEMDMEDVCWETPCEEMNKALDWSFQEVSCIGGYEGN